MANSTTVVSSLAYVAYEAIKTKNKITHRSILGNLKVDPMLVER